MWFFNLGDYIENQSETETTANGFYNCWDFDADTVQWLGLYLVCTHSKSFYK